MFKGEDVFRLHGWGDHLFHHFRRPQPSRWRKINSLNWILQYVNFYCPALAFDCYAMVRICQHCAQVRSKLNKNLTRVELFPAKEPLTSLWICIHCPFISTMLKNIHLLVVTARYLKMNKTINMKFVCDIEVAKHFLNFFAFTYSPHEEVVVDNTEFFKLKYFQDFCRILSSNTNCLAKYRYNAQTNRQV